MEDDDEFPPAYDHSAKTPTFVPKVGDRYRVTYEFEVEDVRVLSPHTHQGDTGIVLVHGRFPDGEDIHTSTRRGHWEFREAASDADIMSVTWLTGWGPNEVAVRRHDGTFQIMDLVPQQHPGEGEQ